MSATAVRPIAGTEPGPAPNRTLEQRLAALVTANAVRSKRSQLKLDLKAGRRNVLDIIEAPPEWVETMKLLDLLMAAPKVGRVKALKLMKQHNISVVKTVAGLSPRQRDELTAAWIWGRR